MLKYIKTNLTWLFAIRLILFYCQCLQVELQESAESLSSISEAMKNDHTYSMYEQNGTCMEEFCCQTRLCLKCRKVIMNILEENERLKNENEQLQKSLKQPK